MTDDLAVHGPRSRFGRSLAVMIGIDAYRDGISPLRSAVADARAVAEALRRDHSFETRCLFDDDTGLPQLLALLRDELPVMLGPADRLLFYFAGHGIALDGETGPAGYLLPVSARRSDRDSFLPMHVLHRELTRLPVRHALVILDCCFAGTFRWSSLRDIEAGVSQIYRERYDRFVESAAWQVLTSASSDQAALDVLAHDRGEGVGAHSPFALALLEGLSGAADYTADNLITASELAVFLRERVEPAMESQGRRQTPQYFALDRHDRGEFVFQVPNRPLELRAAPPLTEDANPYRGLRSFGERDRALYFGRETVVRQLVNAVAAQPLVVVVGPSGCGKSSVVHAGVVPTLRTRGWTVLPTQRPGRSPLAALSALARALYQESSDTDTVTAWLAAVAQRAKEAPTRPWLVIVDQFEELLTHRTAARDQAAFLGALASAIELAPALHIVVTVRSDAEPQFYDSALGPWWTTARFVVPGMSRDDLRDVIEKPAAAFVLHFEPSRLVDRLIDDVALVAAPLPLLSFALSELYGALWQRWSRGAQDRALRDSDYQAMGSVARALTQRATALHDQLVAEDPAYAITIRNIFVRMVAMMSGEVARRRVPRDELVYDDLEENRRIEEVLERFHAARLISLGTENTEDGKATAYAEPTHDELIRGWIKVGNWLDELDNPAGTRGLLGALASAVSSWQLHEQANAYLWSDPRADTAASLGRDRQLVFNAHEALFVGRSARVRRDKRVRLIESLRATRRVLARSYHETGRQLTLDGRTLQAVPYLVEARKGGEIAAPLRMLFFAATRHLPTTPAFEHRLGVPSAAFSADGTRVVTASWDGTARVWDASTGDAVTPPLEHRDRVLSASFSPDGTRVVTASYDHTARVWDATTGQPVTPPLAHRDHVLRAAFSPDGTRVVTASDDKTACVWDAITGGPLAPPLEHGRRVASAAFGRDGTRVVTASGDQTARVWNTSTGTAVTPPLEHRGGVRTAAFSPDGMRVVTASDDKTARVWDATTGEPVAPPFEHPWIVVSAAFSPDGARVVTASDDGTARVWDASTGRTLAPPFEHQGRLLQAAFSPDGRRVVTAGEHGAHLWDAMTGKHVTPALEHQDEVWCAAFNAEGTRVVTASMDKTARVWDVTAGVPPTLILEHQSSVWTAAFSLDGTRVVTASDDKAARVWDAATGELRVPPFQHQDHVLSAAFSPDGNRVASASRDKTARIWDAVTGEPVTAPLEHQHVVRSATFNFDGTCIVTASSDNTARVWNVTAGVPVTPPLAHQGIVRTAVFSPDGTRVVTASADRTARIWDAITGQQLAPALAHQGIVNSAVFSPDGLRVVTASADRTARIWDAITGQQLAPALAHQDVVNSATFSPDGTRIVTASGNRTARIWDAATGRPLAPPLEHRDLVWSAVFSPDSTRVVTASDDKTARVWDAATGKPLTPPLEHDAKVVFAAFSPDAARVITASWDTTARIWQIPLDNGTLAAWSAMAERSPYVLLNGVLSPRVLRASDG